MTTGDDPPRCRLRSVDRVEMTNAILTDLAAHGPSAFRDIERRLLGIVGEGLIRRTLRELVETGRIATEMRTLTKRVGHPSQSRELKYQATIYSIAGPGEQGDRVPQVQPAPRKSQIEVARRAHEERRLALEAAVLADLAAHGASTCSDIRDRLGLASEHFAARALKDLVKSGRATAEVRTFTRMARYLDVRRPMRYQARVYELVAGQPEQKPKGKRGK